jgi:hypothetical protein
MVLSLVSGGSEAGDECPGQFHEEILGAVIRAEYAAPGVQPDLVGGAQDGAARFAGLETVAAQLFGTAIVLANAGKRADVSAVP